MSETFLRPKKVFFKPLKALPNGSGVLENFPNCFELDLLLTTREMMLTAVTEKGLSQRISRLSAKTLKWILIHEGRFLWISWGKALDIEKSSLMLWHFPITELGIKK